MNIQVSAKTFTSAAEQRAHASAVRKRLLNPSASIARRPKPPTALAAVIRKPRVWRPDIPHDEHVKAWRRWRSSLGSPIRNYIVSRCDDFGVTYEEIIGPSRERRLVIPRHMIMWEIKTKLRPDISLPELGRMFGGRDHTSLLYSIRKINNLMDAKAKV
jgi:hypothetical protein